MWGAEIYLKKETEVWLIFFYAMSLDSILIKLEDIVWKEVFGLLCMTKDLVTNSMLYIFELLPRLS